MNFNYKEGGLVLTAEYTSEQGEKKTTSVRIHGGDLPKRNQGPAGRDGLLQYVSELTACVRPAIDKLGEERKISRGDHDVCGGKGTGR